MKSTRNKLIASALFLALAIIMGAFAAHGAKDHLSETYLKVMDTANKYLMYFALIHLGMALSNQMMPSKKVFVSFYAGILLFSGSLYAMCLMDGFHALEFKKYVVALTPIGGLLMIVALLLWTWDLWKLKD